MFEIQAWLKDVFKLAYVLFYINQSLLFVKKINDLDLLRKVGSLQSYHQSNLTHLRSIYSIYHKISWYYNNTPDSQDIYIYITPFSVYKYIIHRIYFYTSLA